MPVRIRARSEKIALNRVEDCGDAGGMGKGDPKRTMLQTSRMALDASTELT